MEGVIRGIAETEKEDAARLLKKFGEAKMYGFLLLHEEETDLWEFLGNNLKYLDDLCGKECHMGIIEKSYPGNLPEWYQFEIDDPDNSEFFEALSEAQQKFLPYDKFNALTIAKNLGIPLNKIPCIVFSDSIPIEEFIYLPIIVDKEYYKEFFKDVFTSVQLSLDSPPKKRLKTLNSKLNFDRLKYNAPIRAEKLSGTIKKLVSPVSPIVDVLSPLIGLIR
ncbi:MAG: hypothetical protein FJ150_02215 [Euryarchaeota archaeon]|nr:hypothetical protein [Euryarchaeota archaeon]